MNRVDLIAYINRLKEAKLKTMYWGKFFDLKQTTQLTWTSLTGSEGAPVMADVVEYNASAPLKSRRTIAKATGDIPKIVIKRGMDEKDYNDYIVMKALSGADADKTELLRIVFNDVNFCYTGCLARTEWLGLQALSTGQLSLDENNNNGKVTEVVVNFGIPTANKSGVTAAWSNPTTGKPITDIRAKAAYIRSKGDTARYIVMDETTYFNMINTDEVKASWALYQRIADNKVAVPSLESLNAMLTAERLPIVYIVDSLVRHESKPKVFTNVSPWKTGKVAFINDLKVGKILHGPIAEENSEALKKIATQTKVDHILVTKWSELEPFGEFTKGQSNCFPTFGDVDSIYLMNTLGTTWSV